MSLSESKKKEISKKFDLPERKSKIATMLKQNDILYCICRSTDSTSFMIACDACEEWFHGTCINITQQESKNIKHYYCAACIENDPTLKIEYKKKKDSTSTSASKDRLTERRKSDHDHSVKSTNTATHSHSQHQEQARRGRGRPPLPSNTAMLKKADVGPPLSSRNANTRTLSSTSDSSDGERSSWTRREPRERPREKKPRAPAYAPKRTKKQALKLKKGKLPSSSSRRAKQTNMYEYSDTTDLDGSEEEASYVLKQCYGPNCTHAARRGSKYCSDKCGINMAAQRIYSILPGRIKELTMTPSIADQHRRRDLEQNELKTHDIRARLESLAREREDLDEHIADVKRMRLNESDDDDEPGDEDSTLVNCVTCGQEVPVKSCMKHMAKCYKKMESQTSFGSIYKTNVEGPPLFCDTFNPTGGTYCKRLAVLCPEHTKDQKIGEREVCGYRLMNKNLSETGEICRTAKRKCNIHFQWEKIQRAILDMERVTQYLKLDDLLEQDRQIKIALSARGNVMGLLLNSCFDHELNEAMGSP